MNQNATQSVAPESRDLSPAWSDAHDAAAAKEGWVIGDCYGSNNGRWQVQRIDNVADFAEALGLIPPQLDRDTDALKIVANGTGEHHIAAREFLRTHNPVEFAAVSKFAQSGQMSESTDSVGSSECHPYVVEIKIGDAVPYCPFDTNFPTQEAAETGAIDFLIDNPDALEARIFRYSDDPGATKVTEVKCIGRSEAESRRLPETERLAVVLLPSGAGEIGIFRVIDLARASGKSADEFAASARENEDFLVDVSMDVGPLMRVPGASYQAAMTGARQELRGSQMADFYEVTLGGAGRWEAPRSNAAQTLWDRDDIQFPRLLAEIMATQSVDMSALAESMDLTIEEVNSLFDRADKAWEAIKAESAPG